MKNTPIRLLVLVGALTMAAIVFIQVYWVSQAIDREEEQFKHSVQMALRNVVESLCVINGNDIPSNDPIDQLSNNYFIARTNYRIDLTSLDYLLRAELEKRQIDLDYEYGVYDCQTDRMVYGDFVSASEDAKTIKPQNDLPKLVKDEYYFGVYFPDKKGGLVNNLGIWQVTSGLTIVILVFFTYALFVILRQRRLSEIQRDFINNMTHEFKTPLATLMVSSEVLAKEATGERQKRYAGIALDEARRLQHHVQLLLETSLLDEQTSGEKPEMIEVNTLVQKAIDRMNGLTPKKISAVLKEEGMALLAPPLLFETILFNLLDNAVKYGEDQIRVSAWTEEAHVLISLWNDGVPIPKKELGKIFKKFYRIGQGDRHDVKGFGLGLYLVKRSTERLGGKISVRSDETGTTFTLKLSKK